MHYYLLVCEAATGIVLMQDYLTRFQKHRSTTELPYIEIETSSFQIAEHRAAAILIMHPEIEVLIFDEHKTYVKMLPADR